MCDSRYPAMPAYTLYGLTIACTVPLDGLRAALPGAPADIRVTFGACAPWLAEPSRGDRYRSATADAVDPSDRIVVTEQASGFQFRYGDGTAFEVSRDGGEIWGRFESRFVLADAVVYLLGPVLGFALRLRGVLCLHASGVVIDGRAVALLGAQGAGKSTTAGLFAAAGFAVLADDLVAVRPVNGRWMAQPAYDHLRVWEDGERILFGESGRLPLLTPTWTKRAVPLEKMGMRFHDTPVALGAIVLLADRSADATATQVNRLEGAAAILAVVRETYANYLLDAPMRAAEVAAVGGLLRNVPIWKATPHTDPARLHQLVERVINRIRVG